MANLFSKRINVHKLKIVLQGCLLLVGSIEFCDLHSSGLEVIIWLAAHIVAHSAAAAVVDQAVCALLEMVGLIIVAETTRFTHPRFDHRIKPGIFKGPSALDPESSGCGIIDSHAGNSEAYLRWVVEIGDDLSKNFGSKVGDMMRLLTLFTTSCNCVSVRSSNGPLEREIAHPLL